MKNKKILSIIIFVLLISSIVSIFFFLDKNTNNDLTSQILFTLMSDENTEVYVYDINQDDFLLISDAKFSYGWSPSGDKLLYENQKGIWVSERYGENPALILDFSEYPTYTMIKEATWLSDNFVVIGLRGNTEQILLGFNLLNKKLSEISLSGINIITSPKENFWIQYRNAHEIATLNGARTKIDVDEDGQLTLMNGSPYGFSPDGDKIVYPFEMDLWVANISDKGLLNPYPLNLPKQSYSNNGDIKWSPDGKYIGFQKFGEDSNRYFYVIDPLSGENKYTLQILSITGSFFWSPYSDAVIFQTFDDGFQITMLDLVTGENTTLVDTQSLNKKTGGFVIVDWRLMPPQ